MSDMRAKFRVMSVEKTETSERIRFYAVGPKGSYPADGSDEDNTYARYTPSAELTITILNPALFGKYVEGTTHYADFTAAQE